MSIRVRVFFLKRGIRREAIGERRKEPGSSGWGE